MWRHCVDISDSNVRFDLVLVHAGACRRMIDRIQKAKQFPGSIAVAQNRKSNHRPERRVGVLASVFTHARHITLYVTGIQIALIERRTKENDESVSATDQVLIY